MSQLTSQRDVATYRAEAQPEPILRRLIVAAWRDGLVVVLYGLLTVGFFWQSIFLPGYHVPAFGGDVVAFVYPLYNFAARTFQDGVIPFWNPYLYAGSPFMADMQTGIFYPINLITFFISHPVTYATVESIDRLHIFLAAIFMYVYMRGLNLSRPAAFGGGVVFAFSGFSIAHLGHVNMLEAAVWLPLILFFFHRALLKHSLRSALLAGVFYSISILAGHTQMTLIMGFFLGLYWLYWISRELLSRRALKTAATGRALAAALVALPVTVITALSTSIFQLLPSFEFVSLSLRSDLTYANSIEYSASPMGFITFFVPRFFGESMANYWGVRWNIAEIYGYVGLLPLLLAMLVLFSRRRWGFGWFLAGLGILFLLLSLGDQTVLHGWLYKFVPGFDKVRDPGRFLLPVDFVVASLAGIGLDILTKPLSRRLHPLYRFFLAVPSVVFAGAVLVIIPLFYYAMLTSQDKDATIFDRTRVVVEGTNLSALFLGLAIFLFLIYRYLPSRRAIVPYMAVVLIVIDLFSAGVTLNQAEGNATNGFQHPMSIEFLKNDQDMFRIDSGTGTEDVWQPNITLLEGVDGVGGFYTPTLSADYDRYWGNLGSRSGAAYDLLNVKYVIGHKDVQLDWGKFKPVLTDAPKVNIYENTRFLPRVIIVPSAQAMNREDILARVKAQDFNPRETLFLENSDRDSLLGPPANPFESQITSVSRPNPNEYVVNLSTNSTAYLLLSEMAYPGWHAYIDGVETKVLRADFMFKAIAMGPGTHEVRFAFWPHWWEVLVPISLVSWLVVIAIGIFSVIQRRNKHRAASSR